MNRAVPNCFITCHLGGGTGNQDEKLARHFLENLRRFEKSELMIDQIIWSKLGHIKR